MTLNDYLKNEKITQRDFARRLGVHYMTIYLILKNKRRPSADMAEKIEKACHGKVKRLELLYPS